MTSPQPDPAELGAYYPETYSPYETNWKGPLFPPGKDFKNALKKEMFRLWYGYFGGPKGGLLEAVKKFSLLPLRNVFLVPPPCRPGGRLLDAGCGAGVYLAFARDLGWSVLGLEYSEQAGRRASEQFRVEVVPGTFEKFETKEKFDVITFWHVLEHFQDPFIVLDKAAKLLKPGGMILLGVPNPAGWECRLFGSRWLSWEAPRHYWHFTPATLEKAANRSGLRVAHLQFDMTTVDAVISTQYVLRDLGLEALNGVGWIWRLMDILLRPVVWLSGALGLSSRMVARLEPAR